MQNEETEEELETVSCEKMKMTEKEVEGEDDKEKGSGGKPHTVGNPQEEEEEEDGGCQKISDSLENCEKVSEEEHSNHNNEQNSLNKQKEEMDESDKKELQAEAFRVVGGKKLRQHNDFKGAVLCYTRAIALVQTNYIYYNNRALAYLGQGKYEETILDCDSSLAIKENAKAYSRKASALGELRRYDDAMDCIMQGLAISPGDKEALNIKVGLSRALAEQKEKDTAAAEELRQEGNVKLQSHRDFRGAVKAYTSAISLVKTNYVFYNNRALAYLAEKEFAKAIADCDTSLGIKENPKAYCRKASVFGEMNRYAEAMEHVNKALALSPEDKEALNIKAGLEKAILGQLVKDLPAAQQHLQEGNELREKTKDFRGAVQAYSKAISLVKTNHLCYDGRAAAYFQKGDFKNAINDCDTSLSMRVSPKALCLKASCLGELLRFGEALECVEQALVLYPGHEEAFHIKDALQQSQGRLCQELDEASENLLQQRKERDEKEFRELNESALVLIRSKDFDEAISKCRASLDVRVNSTAYCRYASALGHKGQIEEAYEILEKSRMSFNSNNNDDGADEFTEVEVFLQKLEQEETVKRERERFAHEQEQIIREVELMSLEEQHANLAEKYSIEKYMSEQREERISRSAEEKRIADELTLEKERLRALESDQDRLLRQANKLAFYKSSRVEVEAEISRFHLGAQMVANAVSFATKVVLTMFESPAERNSRCAQEELYAARAMYRARGLRRLNKDEEELLKAQCYSRKRRTKLPPHFIQSDFYSVNLFKHLKFFNTTREDSGINVLDDRLEVIYSRKSSKVSNASLHRTVDEVSRKLFEQLQNDWGHVRYSLKYIEDEELSISFDTQELLANRKKSDNELSRYMTNMAVKGVTAQANFRPRSDRWKKLEHVEIRTPALEGGCLDGINSKEVLVFSFSVPLLGKDISTRMLNVKTMSQEINAYNKAVIIKNAKKKKIVTKIESPRQHSLPPIQITRRGTGFYQHSKTVQLQPSDMYSSQSRSKTASSSTRRGNSRNKMAKKDKTIVTYSDSKIIKQIDDIKKSRQNV